MITALLPPPLRRAVSPYTGIVRSLEECLAASADPPVPRAVAEVAGLSGIGGAGRTRAEAAAAAVGEALERYSAGVVPEARIVVDTAAGLGREAIEPERFALFSERQYATPGFPYRRFTATSPVPWVGGRALADGRPAWVPAELVFLASVPGSGAPIGYATSSGTACAASREEAVGRGLCELLERDAFMIAWANRLSLPRLDWASDPELAEVDRRFFAPTGLAYTAVDLSCFHRLPSVLGVVRAPRRTPGALGVGAGTAPTVARAWWKALTEAFAARSAGAKLALLDRRDLGGAGEGIVSFEDHIRWHADHDRAAAAAFLDASDARTPVAEVATIRGDVVGALRARVEAAGSSAYVVDVTAPDVAELGLHVAKVVAPELCPLEVPHRARFLGGRRLYEVPVRLGLARVALAEDALNPHPHPFP